MILDYIAGPAVGAVIGCFTNYIAVKMLFYPHKEVKVFGKTLPFTPGAIPKGKPRLAKSVGNVVANNLLTGDDIEQQLLSAVTTEYITDKIMAMLSNSIKGSVVGIVKDEDDFEHIKVKISNKVTDTILKSAIDVNLGSIIAEKGGEVVKDKVAGTMLRMFVTDELINSLSEKLGTEVNSFVEEHGIEYIEPAVNKKLDSIQDKSITDLLDENGMPEEKLRGFIADAYTKAVKEGIPKVTAKLNFSKMIEDKINAMDIDEMEELVLKVMKKELDSIVILGGLIGLLLGIINIFL